MDKLILKKWLLFLVNFWIIFFTGLAGFLVFEFMKPWFGYKYTSGGFEIIVYPMILVLIGSVLFGLFWIRSRLKH